VNVLRSLTEFGDWQPGRASILDIGCGDGLIWPRLVEIGSVVGIEPDASMVAPDSPHRSSIEIADFLQARPRPERYNLILMLDVLEHIDDDRGALAKARSLLAPGGIIVLTVPAMPVLWSEWDVLSGHFRRYTRRTLAQAIRSGGLRSRDMRYYYSWTVPPLLLRRLLFKADQAEHSHFSQPPARPINAALLRLSLADHRFTRRVLVPFGSSLIAVLTGD
jgi:SAM-dependent methyltransferase